MTGVTRERAVREACRLHESVVVSWFTVLDNHEPPRRTAAGFGIRYTNPSGVESFKFWPSEEMTKARRAHYILDDGVRAAVFFASGWNDNDPGALYAQLFPVTHTTTDGSGEQREVDYPNWVLGPRVTYHLKIGNLS